MKLLFSIFAGFVLLASAITTHAAITYVDFGEEGYFPELTYFEYTHANGQYEWTYTAAYSMDLPTNSTSSYSLRYSHYRIDRTNGNDFKNTVVRIYNISTVGASDGHHLIVHKLDEGVSVDSEGPYIGGGLLYDWRSETWNGLWEDMAEGETAYLGFTFTNTDGIDCYGWMELYVDSWDGYVTIYGYAYDDSGNTILTGQTNAVPVPGAVWLLGSALLGLAGVRRL